MPEQPLARSVRLRGRGRCICERRPEREGRRRGRRGGEDEQAGKRPTPLPFEREHGDHAGGQRDDRPATEGEREGGGQRDECRRGSSAGVHAGAKGESGRCQTAENGEDGDGVRVSDRLVEPDAGDRIGRVAKLAGDKALAETGQSYGHGPHDKAPEQGNQALPRHSREAARPSQ